MKCHKPNTDQIVDLTVFANGKACQEYTLPTGSNDTDPNIIECFIPVSTGDQLTISGAFSGSCLHAAFDVLADGSFLVDKRIEGAKSGDVKYYAKRKIDIKKFFDIPKEPARTSIFTPDKVVEGNLHVQTIRDVDEDSRKPVWYGTLADGSLAVVVSLNQTTNDNYTKRYNSSTCADWATGDREHTDTGGIEPTFELEVKVTDNDVSQKRQQKHKRHSASESTRFGSEPWAKLVFYYRSKEAILQAGCKIAGKDSHALAPLKDRASFVYGSKETKKTSAGRKSKKENEAQQEEQGITRMNSIFTTPPPNDVTAHEQQQPTPAPERHQHTTASVEPAGLSITPEQLHTPPATGEKKKLFGRTLPQSVTTSPIAQHVVAVQPEDGLEIALHEYQEERQEDQQTPDPASNPTERLGQETAKEDVSPEQLATFAALREKFLQEQSEMIEDWARGDMSDGELNDVVDGLAAFLATSEKAQHSQAPVAQMLARSPENASEDAMEGVTDSVNEEEIIEEAVTVPATSEEAPDHQATVALMGWVSAEGYTGLIETETDSVGENQSSEKIDVQMMEMSRELHSENVMEAATGSMDEEEDFEDTALVAQVAKKSGVGATEAITSSVSQEKGLEDDVPVSQTMEMSSEKGSKNVTETVNGGVTGETTIANVNIKDEEHDVLEGNTLEAHDGFLPDHEMEFSPISTNINQSTHTANATDTTNDTREVPNLPTSPEIPSPQPESDSHSTPTHSTSGFTSPAMTSPSLSRASPEKTPSKTPLTITVSNIRAHIPAEGITIANLSERCGTPNGDRAFARQFLSLVKQVAVQREEGRYYLIQSGEGGSGDGVADSQGRSQKTASQGGNGSVRGEGSQKTGALDGQPTAMDPGEARARRLMEEYDEYYNAKTEPGTSTQITKRRAPSPIWKHPFLTPSTHDSTPAAKKQRMSMLRERKSAAQLRIQNAAARKAEIEAEWRRREEEELKEIEELERRAREEEEEVRRMEDAGSEEESE